MNRIKLIREEKGLYQKDLAKLLNVSVPAIAQYESGKRDMSTDSLIKLAEYLEVSTDYLLGKSDIRTSNKDKNDDILDLAKVGFTKENYNPPTEKQKEQIRTIIETILADNKKDNKRDDSNK